jgi:hypothetical protein
MYIVYIGAEILTEIMRGYDDLSFKSRVGGGSGGREERRNIS